MPLDFFIKTPLSEKLPMEMIGFIGDLKVSPNKEEYLKDVYDFLSNKYQGARVQTYLKLPLAFKMDIWGKNYGIKFGNYAK